MFKKGKSLEILDPTLATKAAEEQVVLCTHIGLLCTQSDPSLRPTMQRVLVMLSKKSSSLEDPTRPASSTASHRHHRRSRHPGPPSSSNAGTSGASSTSRSQASGSSTNNTNTATATATSANATMSSALRSPVPRLLDPHGKRPMDSY
ncbi:hypothetical protein V2J09_003521 [Rumex salicifolius]